ncbi:FtsK/SpoIIIE domain-containing protein [Clostridium cellulovorans]|uniref:FtsK/SpoIIIE domain-containing protein n=1 Tax=Clostridium cellulovorans TaxID=1493 RepID=UPI0001A97258|nr:FtsK/SpoIIIE domain-containing protein [Clostridium cellulovorans]
MSNLKESAFCQPNNNSDTDWKEVIYPTTIETGLFSFIILTAFIILETYFFIRLNRVIPPLYINVPIIYRSIRFNGLINIVVLLLWGYSIYEAIKLYMRIDKNKTNPTIEKSLVYMIHSLKLFDEESFEIEKDGKKKIEKRIVRIIRIFYNDDDKKVYVRIAKDGDRFTKEAAALGNNLESALGMNLDVMNTTVNYVEYVFLKYNDRRLDLATSIKQKTFDIINISGNISYQLSKTPHSLIVGGTGSGKSFFILGKIVSYLSLTPQADLYIIDPKKADLSLLRFIEGFEDKVATEPNKIAKLLREVVELMEKRYSEYFNDISAFGRLIAILGYPLSLLYLTSSLHFFIL